MKNFGEREVISYTFRKIECLYPENVNRRRNLAAHLHLGWGKGLIRERQNFLEGGGEKSSLGL